MVSRTIIIRAGCKENPEADDQRIFRNEVVIILVIKLMNSCANTLDYNLWVRGWYKRKRILLQVHRWMPAIYL